MAAVRGKISLAIICTIISLGSSANVEESQSNKVEDENTDAGSRNARYIRYQGTPYYYQNTGGYYYPNRDRDYYYPDRYPGTNQFPGGTTQFYPDRQPNKFDPSYWLSKLPGFGNTPGSPSGYPNQNYPNYAPGGGTNFIGYNPYPNRYPGGYPHTSYPQSGYPQSGYPQSGYPQSGYPQSGYPQSGYPGTGGYAGHGNGGYGGYQGNGGLTSYSGYDGYYAAGNRPGNIGFGYQNSRTNGIIGTSGRYPNTLLPIATPSTVSKDAK